MKSLFPLLRFKCFWVYFILICDLRTPNVLGVQWQWVFGGENALKQTYSAQYSSKCAHAITV